MSDEYVEVENGQVELAGSPDHVNVIASDGDGEVEIRVTPSNMGKLAWAMREDQPFNAEEDGGVVAWEPGRGLYVEEYGGDDFYLICSPDQQETLARAFSDARPV